MELSGQLQCLFSARIDAQDESDVVEIPEQEIRLGDIERGETYRVAILPAPSTGDAEPVEPEPTHERGPSKPPVAEGEQRTVEIDGLGDQGDGLTRVERGFVVIVPDTEQGEQVRIEITDVRETVAFADVVERLSYYE